MNKGFYVVGIGASAGGLEPLQEFLASVSSTLNAAFVVVTHLMREPRTNLHTLLSRHTSMKVELVERTIRLMPKVVYVIPGHLIVKLRQAVLVTRERTKEEIINRAIDQFFLSLAEDKRDHAVAVILSGMGKDGAAGVKAVHGNGGLVLVQDPSTTAFSSMPVEAIKADHPQEVLSPRKLAEAFNGFMERKTLVTS